MLLAFVAAACVSGLVSPSPLPSGPPAQSQVSGVVTLADALARARERSPLLEAARARERASADARAAVPRMPNPVVELRGENYGPRASTGLTRDVFATVSQPIELGGKRGARLAEASAVLHLSATDVAAAEAALAADVATLYIDAVRARAASRTLGDQRDSIAEIVGVLAARVREGVGVEADLRRFETERARLASQATRASVALQSALLRLSAVIGDPLGADLLVTPDPPPSVPLPLDQVEAVIPNRPDVRGAEARLERAEALLATERSLRVPDVSVTAGYKRTEGFDTGVAGLTMAIPLFDRNRAAAARAAGEAGAARLELQQVRQLAVADVRARWAAAQELAAQAARIREDLTEPAAVVRAAARAAFVEGRGDVLQLVDAERVFGETSREAVELALDAALAAIHARLAMGASPLP